MKKLVKRVVPLVLACSLSVVPVYATPNQDSLQKEKENVQGEMTSLQNQLSAILTQINETEAQMVKNGEELLQASEDLEAAKLKEKEQYEAMKSRIVMMYENGNTSMLEMIFQSGSIVEMLKKAENVQAMHSYDRKELENYVQTKEKVSVLKASLEAEKQKLEENQAAFEKQQASLDRLIAEKKEEIQDLEAQIREAARIAAEEAARKKAAEEAERKRREEEENKKNQQNNNSTSGNSTPDNSGNNTVSDSSKAQTIVNAAYSQLGVTYVWGGTTPGVGLDCSGLTQYCHKVAGISIPRVSGDQAARGKEVPLGAVNVVENALPGDIICYPGHVAIYIGGGKVIHAPQTGDVVKVAGYKMGKPVTTIRRYW